MGGRGREAARTGGAAVWMRMDGCGQAGSPLTHALPGVGAPEGESTESSPLNTQPSAGPAMDQSTTSQVHQRPDAGMPPVPGKLRTHSQVALGAPVDTRVTVLAPPGNAPRCVGLEAVQYLAHS